MLCRYSMFTHWFHVQMSPSVNFPHCYSGNLAGLDQVRPPPARHTSGFTALTLMRRLQQRKVKERQKMRDLFLTSKVLIALQDGRGRRQTRTWTAGGRALTRATAERLTSANLNGITTLKWCASSGLPQCYWTERFKSCRNQSFSEGCDSKIK